MKFNIDAFKRFNKYVNTPEKVGRVDGLVGAKAVWATKLLLAAAEGFKNKVITRLYKWVGGYVLCGWTLSDPDGERKRNESGIDSDITRNTDECRHAHCYKVLLLPWTSDWHTSFVL